MQNVAFKYFHLDYTSLKNGAPDLVSFLNDVNTGEIFDIRFKSSDSSEQVKYYIIYEDLSKISKENTNE